MKPAGLHQWWHKHPVTVAYLCVIATVDFIANVAYILGWSP